MRSAYTAGAIVGTGALGVALAGDPRRRGARPAGRSSCRTRARSCCCCCWRRRSRPICSACSSCRCSAASAARPAASAPARSPRSSRRPAPGRSSARRSARRCCCRWRDRCWCSPRSGLASRSRSSLIAFVPELRTRLPKPGSWMVRLQRFLAIPMAATRRRLPVAAVAAGGRRALAVGAAGDARAGCSARFRRDGCSARASGRRLAVARWRLSSAIVAAARLPAPCRSARRVAARRRGMERGARSRAYVAAGQAGVRLFHRRLVPDLQGQ